MGGIILGAIMIGASFGWRAEIIPEADTPAGSLLLSHLLGGFGFGLLVAGILQEILNAVRPGSVRSIFRRKEG